MSDDLKTVAPGAATLDRRTCLKALALGAAALPRLSPGAGSPRADLGTVLEPVRQKHRLPALAGAVVQAGRIVSAGVSGVRAQGSPVRATLTDRFHLGSDTKAMTATLSGMAVETGHLKWESAVGEVLEVPGMNAQLAAVTLEQLLSHCGGIPSDTPEMLRLYFNTDAFEYNLTTLRARMIEAWKANAPVSAPGKAFHYANFGYLLAGAMLEKSLGLSWEELITQRIFDPLKLTSAGLGAQATPGRLDAPVGHQLDDKGNATPMYWGAGADIPPALGPAGTAHMSVLDFAAWAGWNAGGGRRGPLLVKPGTLARIHARHVDTGRIPHPRPGVPAEGAYCMGWGLVKFPWSRTELLTHNGSNSMNLAKILVDTARDVGVVLVTNFPGDRAEDALNEALPLLYRPYGTG